MKYRNTKELVCKIVQFNSGLLLRFVNENKCEKNELFERKRHLVNDKRPYYDLLPLPRPFPIDGCVIFFPY